MSYDLYFTGQSFNQSDLEKYFDTRNHYKIQNNQAWYQNEDTGVYFSFELSDSGDRDPESPQCDLSFNLNFYRPHIFALEAEPEVHALVNEFGFGVFDPQGEGMGEGAYSTEGFLRGWNHGNEFGYHAIFSGENAPKSVFFLPGKTIEEVWRWNYAKESVQKKLGENIFVPRIFLMFFKKGVITTAVWPDAIPTLIPEIDYLLVPRKEYGPTKLFKKVEDNCLVPLSEARQLISPYATTQFAMPAYQLQYPSPPSSIKSFVKQLSPISQPIQSIQKISMDSILNEELVVKYRKAS